MSVENPNAFPFAAEYGHPGACGGMTLRDYFAGQALPYACSINEQYLKAHPDASYPFHARSFSRSLNELRPPQRCRDDLECSSYTWQVRLKADVKAHLKNARSNAYATGRLMEHYQAVLAALAPTKGDVS